MKFYRRTFQLLWLCLPAFLFVVGCQPGSPTYKVTGQVLLNGKPLTVQPVVGRVMVKFLRVYDDPAKVVDPKYAIYDEKTGKFSVPGPDGKGIEPGKYRVAVYQYDPFPQTDKLGGKFSDKNSIITADVTGAQDFPIELSQYMK